MKKAMLYEILVLIKNYFSEFSILINNNMICSMKRNVLQNIIIEKVNTKLFMTHVEEKFDLYFFH